MQYMILAFQVIFPTFFYMLTGYAVKKTRLVDKQGFDAMNRFVFRLLLPLKLFTETFESDFTSSFRPDVILFSLTSIVICFLLLLVIVPRIVKGNNNISVVAQGMYRSNYILLGIAIADGLYPGQSLGLVSILSAFAIPLFNVLSVILFELNRGVRLRLTAVLHGIAANPLIIAGVLGIILALTDIRLPKLLLQPVRAMGAASTPIAILCLGASFSFAALKTYGKYLFYTCLGRLLMVPAVIVSTAVLMGFEGMALAAIMLLFATPASTSSYSMAKEYGANAELAGLIVAVTSIISVGSIFLWIIGLHIMQLL